MERIKDGACDVTLNRPNATQINNVAVPNGFAN